MNILKAQETRKTYTIRVSTDELIRKIKWLDKRNESIKSIEDDRGGSGGWVIYVYLPPLPIVYAEEEV